MVKVEQLMKQNLVAVEAGTLVVDVAKVMRFHDVGSVLVSEKGRIVGIVTESDLVKKFLGGEKVPYFISVEQIMSSPVIGIEGDRPITEAADLMNTHKTRHLAVIKSGTFIGIVSVRDLLKPVAIDDF